jgi:hypothetical protein
VLIRVALPNETDRVSRLQSAWPTVLSNPVRAIHAVTAWRDALLLVLLCNAEFA